MKPYFEEDGITIYNADCRAVLPSLQGVDLVLTDPPYGMGFRGQAWDNEIPVWLDIARAHAPCVAFTTAPTTQWDYPRPDWVGCFYRPASSSRTATGGFNHWSPILIYGKHKLSVDSINLHAIANSSPKGFHVCPKPIRLMRWLVGELSIESDLVCDPFMGSGTTGVACAIEGRRFIGIEIEKSYCDLAIARIKRARGQYAEIPRLIRNDKPTPLFG